MNLCPLPDTAWRILPGCQGQSPDAVPGHKLRKVEVITLTKCKKMVNLCNNVRDCQNHDRLQSYT